MRLLSPSAVPTSKRSFPGPNLRRNTDNLQKQAAGRVFSRGRPGTGLLAAFGLLQHKSGLLYSGRRLINRTEADPALVLIDKSATKASR